MTPLYTFWHILFKFGREINLIILALNNGHQNRIFCWKFLRQSNIIDYSINIPFWKIWIFLNTNMWNWELRNECFIQKAIKSVIINMNYTPFYLCLCFWLHYAIKFEMMCIHCVIESAAVWSKMSNCALQ